MSDSSQTDSEEGSEAGESGDDSEGSGWASSLIDSLVSLPNRIKEGFTVYLENFKDSLASLKDNIAALPQKILDGIDSAIESVSGWIDNILYDLRVTLPNKFTELKDNIVEKLAEHLAPLLEIRDNIINGFLELPQKIIEKVQAFTEEYFLPDQENIQAHIDDIREQFGFIDSMTGYGEHLLNFLKSASGVKAPVIQIDLSKKGGTYSWGTQTITMDFSWYTPYKPLVDNIVAGIIWATWLWHMYKRIPEIIHGQGMTTERVLDLSGKR